MKEPTLIDRRKFIGQMGCAALGTTGLLSTLLNLGLATKATGAEMSDYKAVICLFLLGGNDSYNMLVPTDADEFMCYLSARGGVYDSDKNPAGMGLVAPGTGAVSLLPIQPTNLPGRGFGIHPNMPDLKRLFDSESLAFVANVGSLQKPFADVAAYKKSVSDRPLSLFSHSDQQQQWQTCMPDKRSAIGWAGRAMDILQKDQSRAGKFTFNISLSGTNIFQTGNSIAPYTMNVNGLVPLEGYKPQGLAGLENRGTRESYARSQAVDKLLGGIYRNVFESTYAKATIDAQSALKQYETNLSHDAHPGWDVSKAGQLEKQLKLIANVIGAYKNGPTKRQTFFVAVGGFDMHKSLMTLHPGVLENVSTAIGKFWSNLSPEAKPCVTLFSASDFGRSLSSNGSGTDHAWGGNQFVLGGAVRGKRVYGTYPTFAPDVISTNYDVGQGRFIPGCSVEEYVYPILKWFGVSDNDLFGTVFPGYATRFGTGGIRTAHPLYG